MTAQLSTSVVNPRDDIERFISHHGAMPILLATIRALLVPRRRQPRPPDVAHLCDHMRKDIGLPPAHSYEPPKYYDLR